MNDGPMLSKMDALLKKHRGDADRDGDAARTHTVTAAPPPATPATSCAPPNAWLPVLTQVIERGTPPPGAATAAAASASPAVAPLQSDTLGETPFAAESPPPGDLQTTPIVPVMDNALAEQLMSELAPRLSEAMEKQVASELRKNIDQTVATLLSQLDVNVREIVRDAIAEKLKQPRDPAT